MRLYKGSQTSLALLLLMHAAITVVAAVNFTQCLDDIIQNADATHNLTGLLDGNGDPVSNVSDATSISYSNQCMAATNIALISQLPFGAQYRLDNFMSAVLTVGSPTLAGYSLFITLLNSRWIKRRYSIQWRGHWLYVVMLPASSRRALAITAKEDDVMSPDELLTPPVFNYSRSLRWASTVDTILMVFKVASDARSHPPVYGSERVESGINIDDSNQCGSLQCAQPNEVQILSSHWAPGVFTRMVIASCASLALQWGTVGAAFLVGWFTPTTRLGCRTIGYLLYGVISTLVWMMLLMSSILAHSSAANPHRVSAHVASAFSCYCNSSVPGRRGAAYAVIIETTAQVAQAKAAWIGASILACTSASFFLGILNLLSDTLPS
ncbi:hypothetical protein BDR07DRAFT_1371673 [Suillus spraguei]|nr:hypothetical protein BDR07DRAFT_1371673 [Suillus spraguei]